MTQSTSTSLAPSVSFSSMHHRGETATGAWHSRHSLPRSKMRSLLIICTLHVVYWHSPPTAPATDMKATCRWQFLHLGASRAGEACPRNSSGHPVIHRQQISPVTAPAIPAAMYGVREYLSTVSTVTSCCTRLTHVAAASRIDESIRKQDACSPVAATSIQDVVSFGIIDTKSTPAQHSIICSTEISARRHGLLSAPVLAEPEPAASVRRFAWIQLAAFARAADGHLIKHNTCRAGDSRSQRFGIQGASAHIGEVFHGWLPTTPSNVHIYMIYVYRRC